METGILSRSFNILMLDEKIIESGKLKYRMMDPKRDPDTGLILDTGEYDEEAEELRRHAAWDMAGYAEEGEHFDPTGLYLCGGPAGDGVNGCNQFRPGSKACLSVKGKIDGDCGSCRWWEVYNLEHADLQLGPEKSSKSGADYGEREPGGTGFGCQRCEYGKRAQKPDDKGRVLWCGIWGAHVQELACCGRNHRVGDTVFEDNRPLTQIEFYKKI